MRRTAILLALLCGVAFAQAPAVPTNVSSIVTVGWWQDGQKSGTYRVVVVSQGWEHVWSQAYVEWLAEPRDRYSLQEVVQVKELVPPIAQGTAVLSVAARPRRVGELAITVSATSNAQAKAKATHFLYCARTPGVVEPCPATRK